MGQNGASRRANGVRYHPDMDSPCAITTGGSPVVRDRREMRANMRRPFTTVQTPRKRPNGSSTPAPPVPPVPDCAAFRRHAIVAQSEPGGERHGRAYLTE